MYILDIRNIKKKLSTYFVLLPTYVFWLEVVKIVYKNVKIVYKNTSSLIFI